MDVIFEDEALWELYKDGTTKDKKYRKLARNSQFVQSYTLVIQLMMAAVNANALSRYSYLHYEKLRHRPESSVRIQNGRVERLLFTEHEGGVKVRLIEIDVNHYGKKR